ncbi:MAG: ABC transporter substrate-binding protein [Ferruginibacter sp.]|nr:ABC transporter substrate-binding protein [Bacteroidota bacterium]MBX2918636.1 ABC transporter substrate-binding protein [Ferruginibacter sp.]MCB0708172.1 ABC transporter substrate-binding protein [Chitinophagaceae bacterium]
MHLSSKKCSFNSSINLTCIAIVFLYMLIFLSCKSHSHPGKKIFRYNESSGLATLDPAFAKNKQVMWACHQLYNTLIEIDSNMQMQPSLATHWSISNDNLTFTFFLRNDVFFTDDACFINGKGRKLTAHDVEYSFNRIIDKNTASPGAWIFNNRVDSVNGFKAIDDTTFQLKLLRPFQSILGILSMQYCSIIPKEAVEKYTTDFRRHPVGTGPFQFVAWEEGQALILKKNENYFEQDAAGNRLPYLDGVKVSFYDSKATEFLEFQQNRLDFIDDIDPSFKDEVLTKTGNLKKDWQGKIVLQKHPYLNIEYLGILVDEQNELVKNSPLRIKKLRQAINYGFNRRKMMLYLRNSIGIAAESGFVPAGLPSFDSVTVKGYHYDVVKAKQLLIDAGFPGGKNLPTIKLLTIPVYGDLGSFIANELLQIGIKVQVEVIQKSLLMEQTSKSQALFFRGSWIADYPDAENYLSVFYGKNPAPPNYTRYKNPAYDRLYESALSEKNDSIRYELYRQMDRMVMEDAPVVPLWYDMAIHLVHLNITNFYPNSLNLLELRKVKKL